MIDLAYAFADTLVRAGLLAIIALFILGAIALLTTGPLIAPPGYDEPPTPDDEWALRELRAANARQGVDR